MSTLTQKKFFFKKIIIRVSQKFCPQTYNLNFLKSIPLNFDQKFSDASSNTLVYGEKIKVWTFSIFGVQNWILKIFGTP